MGKKALLIGCNYPGTKAELKGCINDVERMYKCLVDRYGFSNDDITVLVDTNKDSSADQLPTGKNIRNALNHLVQSAKPGDVLFLHYSGHGYRSPANADEHDETGYDECIVPCDMDFIIDNEFRDFVKEIPKGCHITIVSDSCHSGGLIDGAKEQIGESTMHRYNDQDVLDHGGMFKDFLVGIKNMEKEEKEIRYGGVLQGHMMRNRSLPQSIQKPKTVAYGKDGIDVGKLKVTIFDMFGKNASTNKVNKFMKEIMNNEEYSKSALTTQVNSKQKQKIYDGSSKCSALVVDGGILISACQTNQISADATPLGNAAPSYGALSDAIQTIIAESDGSIGNRELVLKARKMLQSKGFTQRPGLYCSDHLLDAPFLC